MLVMLIIFLVTIPVIVKTVPVQLPTYRNIATQTKPENIVIAVDEGREHLLQQRADRSSDDGTLRRRPEAGGQWPGKPLPEVHIRGDKNVRFEAVGRVILACSRPASRKSASSPNRQTTLKPVKQ
jgi:biopolymer transport protein ExbD